MLIQADARALPLADACVDCCVTSPPYFGLRDYGSVHQIGLEGTPDAYVRVLVDVFGEVRRVLKPQGVCWLNLGDSYNSAFGMGRGPARRGSDTFKQTEGRLRPVLDAAKSKDLLGIPWRVAFALRADGWYLRSDIIWSKPNPMPESVTDRPTKAHEYLFLLSKSERYFYDAGAIREPNSDSTLARDLSSPGTHQGIGKSPKYYSHGMAQSGPRLVEAGSGRNRRSVWTIPTMPYAGAHFATMPEALVEPCILAGCPMGGLVLDPFSGSGTVLAVAERLGRRGVGVDLNPAYHQLAKERTRQRGLRFGEASA